MFPIPMFQKRLQSSLLSALMKGVHYNSSRSQQRDSQTSKQVSTNRVLMLPWLTLRAAGWGHSPTSSLLQVVCSR